MLRRLPPGGAAPGERRAALLGGARAAAEGFGQLGERPVGVVLGLGTQVQGVRHGVLAQRVGPLQHRLGLGLGPGTGLVAQPLGLGADLGGGRLGGLVHPGRRHQPGVLAPTGLDDLLRVLVGLVQRDVRRGNGRRPAGPRPEPPPPPAHGWPRCRPRGAIRRDWRSCGAPPASPGASCRAVRPADPAPARAGPRRTRTSAGCGRSPPARPTRSAARRCGAATGRSRHHLVPATRSMSRLWTFAGTSAVTSPPHRAISLTRLEARKLYSGFVGMKRVSMPARPRFICAICSS